MRKYHTNLLDLQTGPRRRSRIALALIIVFCLMLAPVVFEGVQVLYSQWQGMTGTYWVPKTPVLDALGEWSRSANQTARFQAGRWLNSGPWTPSMAVPLAIGWAATMALVFLRKVR